MTGKAVFLDKDGTVIEDVPYNVDPALMRLTAGAGAALRRLHAAGYRLFVVSNQSGVARGYFREEALIPVEARLRELLAAEAVPLAGFYYCPHHPDGAVDAYRRVCECRKPAPGMLLRAMADHEIAAGVSWMIGDILDDVEAGRRAGCRTVFLDIGHETQWVDGECRRPHHRARGLEEAAEIVLQASNPDGASASPPNA